MSTNTLPESQTHNFISAAQEGIDPRTGLFSFAFPVATLSAADNQAPFLPLTLSWSALQGGNPHGLGQGIAYGLTTYDDSDPVGRLTLSSGERSRADVISGGQHADRLSLRQCLLPSFRLSKTDGDDDNALILIHHRDGHTEALRRKGLHLWVPVSITAPTGRALTLEWDGGQSRVCLMNVKDDTGRVLYRFTLGDMPVITVWPDTDEAVTLQLYQKDGYLSEIHNVSDPAEKLVWTLGWATETSLRFPGGLLPLTSVSTPTGLCHTVTWASGKMRFRTRNNATGSLPVVVRSRLEPGGGRPGQTVTYRYSATDRNPDDGTTVLGHNWLGWGAAFSDSEFDDDSDNLLSLRQPYHYWSEATLRGDDDGNAPGTVVLRTYNRFHLMTEERTSRGDCSHTQTVEYFADEQKPLAE